MTAGQWALAIAVSVGVVCVIVWTRRRPSAEGGDHVSQAWRDEHVRLRKER